MENEISKEEKLLGGIVKKLVDNGTLDDLVVAVLEGALEDALEDLDKLTKKPYMEAHHWMDYVNGIRFSRAAIRVLQYFSTHYYDKEQTLVDQYSLKVEEIL